MPKIDIEKFAADVQRAQEELGISRRQAAKEAGVGHAYVDKLINGELKRPMYKSVSSLCSALGLDVADYYPDGVPELQQEEVIEMYEAAKDAVKHADAMRDEMKEQLNTLKVKSPDEGVEPDVAVPGQGMTHEQQIEELLAAIDHINESLNRVTIERDAAAREQKETELEFSSAKSEIAELKNALDIKNRSIAEKSRLVDSLTIDLRADDKLILALLDFIQRLKDGGVAR